MNQLQSEITQLESNPAKNQAELESKRKKLKELEEKEKQLFKSLPITTQISNLKREIKDLENKSTRTKAEEALLTKKKKQLAELLKKQQDANTNNSAKSSSSFYDSLLNFPFVSDKDINNGKVLSLCCDNSRCFLESSKICFYPSLSFYCNKIAQMIFCGGVEEPCGGIINDTLITDFNSIGSCKIDSNNMEISLTKAATVCTLINNDYRICDKAPFPTFNGSYATIDSTPSNSSYTYYGLAPVNYFLMGVSVVGIVIISSTGGIIWGIIYKRKIKKKDLKLLKELIELATVDEVLGDEILGKEEINEGKLPLFSSGLFKTWFSDNCAIIISKKSTLKGYCLWIAVCESTFEKNKTDVKLIKAIVRDLKSTLENSDYPAAEIHNNVYAPNLPVLSQDYKNIVKKTTTLTPTDDPNN
ncbi:4150_t:CDS:2 [Ambispora leptoticha]|uniref:4150_t:CDS:1 n=1 Tax=Ambispora leptoticha TaxID=144679 RepID=A0A9N9BLL8_9GLOM|nr:4150_t:CDS:2 [Ambispora leptoticha]